MEKPDGLVLDALEERVLAPERLPKLLTAFLENSDESDQLRCEELALLRGWREPSLLRPRTAGRKCPVSLGNGAPDRIRTCDLCLRRAALYPAELRVRGCAR